MSTQHPESGSNRPKEHYTLFYDGACPLCRKEVGWLKKRCRKKPAPLRFVDISHGDFDSRKTGKSQQQLMALLHLKSDSGQWWVGMAASRKLYRLIGLGWLLAPTGWPVLKPIADYAYRLFARYRPRLQKNSCPRCIR